jgi:signal transduction histidine kinase
MTQPTEIIPGTPALAEFWEKAYKRQNQLITAVMSLLSRYGDTVSTEELYRTFVLTLMGHFAVSDATLYVPGKDAAALEATLAYGRVPVSALPALSLDDAAVAGLFARRHAGPLRARSEEATTQEALDVLAQHYRLIAPLSLKNKALGLVFLGPRLSGQPYNEFDITLLDSLASVSAATFNDAIMYQNARLSAEELRKLLEIRSEVISRVSHEFRTPITVLRAGIDMLPAELASRTWMSASLDRLQTLIESLLTLGEQHPGGDVCESNPLAVVHAGVGAVSAVAAERDIRISVSCSEAAHSARAAATPEAVKLIVDAVLDNALAYSGNGTMIDVRVEVVDGGDEPARDGVRLPEWVEATEDRIREFTALADALESTQAALPVRRPVPHDARRRHVVIRIADQGIGIPADEIELVAEPFRQASNSPNRGIKGKGLGLSMACRSAEFSGGFICCKSSVGQGTVISVFLPTGV